MALSPLDLAIISVPFVIVIVFALYLRRYMRSVADFLAASRTAGRYLICTASAETAAAFAVAGMEMTSQAGFSLGFWGMFGAMVTLFMILTGFVGYRFRETRALTFHQFLEVRYSRNFRVFAGFLGFLSGIIAFGIAPGVMARFVVYFAGLPISLSVGGLTVPTHAVLMVVFLGFALFYTISGGQVTVMLTDALEGIMSGLMYITVGIAVVVLFSWRQVSVALVSGPPGQSYINPFDTTARADFNIWYMLIGILLSIYNFRGVSAFSTAARSAHEAKMAGVLGWWRGFVGTGFGTLVMLAAFTVLHNPDFAHHQASINTILDTIPNESVRSQMRIPLAIRMMLPAGIRGAFFTIGLFGIIASFGSALHGHGGTFVQDVVLPFRTKPLDPKTHIRWLRLGVFGVALFGFIFSMLFIPSDALMLFGSFAGAIYLGGAGAAIIGGLYWKRGTTQGAWVSMILGCVLALVGRIGYETWNRGLHTWLVQHTGPGALHEYLLAHADRFPLNAQWMSLYIAIISTISYVVVSLLTHEEGFDMDRMLHRGKYAIEKIAEINVAAKRRFSFGKLIGVDEHYTLGDKFIAYGIFTWEFGSNVIGLIILLWNIFFWRWPDSWWLMWMGVRGALLIPLIGFAVVIWISIGAIRDMIKLLRALKTAVRNDADDGMVRGHHNLGEPDPNNKPAKP